MLRLNEQFVSISGEVGKIPQGALTHFIRFQGCSACCAWCDTPKALSTTGGVELPWKEIANQIPCEANVILTGGEPLEQPKAPLGKLIDELIMRKCTVQIETNGSILNPFPGVHTVYDYKTPSSKQTEKMMHLDNFFTPAMMPQHWIKFVIKDIADADFTMALLNKVNIEFIVKKRVVIALSVDCLASVTYLKERILKEEQWLASHVIFNFQLHKMLDLP